MLYSLSSSINLLKLLNLQGLCGWLLALGQFQISSPWSRSLTNSDFKGGACTYACIWPIIWSIIRSVGHDQIALKWVACFVTIRLLSDELLKLGQWFLVICLYELSCPLVSQTARNLRQNLFINRLRTCIWASTRITLDHLAITRSSTFSKLLAFWLGNLQPLLSQVARVCWSWRWHPKSHISCIQVTLFSHRYNGSSSGFVEREL